VNVSVRPRGSKVLGTKTEIKNLNSFKFLQKALEYEIRRQVSVIEAGGMVVQETRLFDSARGVTSAMRTKEEAHDYRYFPDPDLLPLVIEDGFIEEVRRSIPELPDERRKRFVEQYGLPPYDAAVLTETRAMAEYFEECLVHFRKPKIVSNWIMTEVMRELKGEEEGITAFPVTPSMLAGLLKLIDEGTINRALGKDIFSEMVRTGREAADIVAEKGIRQITDTAELEALIKRIVDGFPDEVSRYRGGQTKLFGFFMGQIMKESKGKANPDIVRELLEKKLAEG
ncbi:MAG: hypothetical protein QXI19_10610, partial [Candidatus Caldarchaeum sp.]